ncbi:FAD binding domain-containing protein, partial [Acidobacteriota bacterium]
YEKFNIIKNHQGIVSIAASVTLDEKKQICEDIRIVLGAAAPIPLRAKGAEQILKGKKLDEKLIEKAGVKASEECDPVGDIHASESYRRYLVKTLTIKMVRKAWDQAKDSN